MDGCLAFCGLILAIIIKGGIIDSLDSWYYKYWYF